MFIINFLYGLIIGLGFIIPGVSGGVIATILGIYNEIIDRLNNLFNNFKDNLIYITPIIIGVITSVLLFSNLILYLLENKLFYISYIFIGLILGCIPYLIKEIKIKTNKNVAIIPFVISLLFGITLFFVEKTNISSFTTPNTLVMLIAGLLYAIGKIIPGISGAALLMLLGVYEYFLSIIANPLNLTIDILFSFIPFIISFIISAIIILKLTSYLLNNHFRLSYSVIIGFVISSILFIYPGSFSLLSIIIICFSFLVSYHLSN